MLAIQIDDDRSVASHLVNNGEISYPVGTLTGGNEMDKLIPAVPYTVVLDRSGQFVEFTDPESGLLTFAVIGPRDWNGEKPLKELKQIIRPNDPLAVFPTRG